MTDARWLDVDDDINEAVKHFSGAVAIYDEGLSADDNLQAYKGRMAYMQDMQAGYTTLETALERILEILGEEKPAGQKDYHAQLINRLKREIPGIRPAVFEDEVFDAVDEARRFRHVARKNYSNFKLEKAAPSVEAARLLIEQIS